MHLPVLPLSCRRAAVPNQPYDGMTAKDPSSQAIARLTVQNENLFRRIKNFLMKLFKNIRDDAQVVQAITEKALWNPPGLWVRITQLPKSALKMPPEGPEGGGVDG